MTTYDLTSSIPSTIVTGDILNCPYSGAVKSLTLPRGVYQLECWGAQGGYRSSTYGTGGAGGYSVGTITFEDETTVYLYAGGTGSSAGTSTSFTGGGFNGGGNSKYYGGGGGGASDIRIGTDSLYARVIVAGGGGGAQGRASSSYKANGGAGGGETGQYGGYYATQPSGTTAVSSGGYPGTATAAGATVNSTYGNTAGSFGTGGDGGYYSTTYCGVGGGGGGWYGGGTGYYRYAGGGGGSGYVYTSDTASNYPSGCLLNSDYYLTGASTTIGSSSFLSPTGTSETGHADSGYVRITVLSDFKALDIKKGDVLDYAYSGSFQAVCLPKGTYRLECWGAQGGSFSTTYYGGKGGYSTGTLTLKDTTVLYIYAGGQGTDGTTSGTFAGGFNGGGQAYTSSATYDMSAGGGASDIRIGANSLYARVIVAGGGGGAGSYSGSYRYVGGAGGGTSGGAGSKYSTSYPAGGAGTATAAGTSYYGSSYTNSTSYGTPASFGTGGAAASSGYVAGGGGGWYGGGYANRASGGGGSGYVYTSDTASNYPSGCLLNSTYYLTDASTTIGTSSFTGTTGSSETGHAGDGHVRITVIKAGSDFKIKNNGSIYTSSASYVKINGVWKEISDRFIKVNGEWVK